MSAWMSCRTAWSAHTAESVSSSLRFRTVDPRAEGGGSECVQDAPCLRHDALRLAVVFPRDEHERVGGPSAGGR